MHFLRSKSCRKRKIQTLGVLLLIVVIYYFLQFFWLSRLGGVSERGGHNFRFQASKAKANNAKDAKADNEKSDDRPDDSDAAGVGGGEKTEKVPRGVHPSEADLYRPDSSGLFKCLQFELRIPAEQVNDDFCDCPDSSDEPGTSACPQGRFFCKIQLPGQDAQFAHSSKVNDGICDCCDGSDEWQGRRVPAPMQLRGKRGAVFHAPCVDRCGDVVQILEHQEKVRRQGVILQKAYLEAARELSPKHQHKFGPLGIFYLLSKQCYQHAAHEYLYTVCPFESVQQGRGTAGKATLGREGRWARQKPGDYLLLMGGGDAALCPDGGPRETAIRFLCGLEDRVLSVSEDQKCRYEVRFSTPAAC